MIRSTPHQQEKTALIDTAGSNFVAECSTLIGEGKFAAFLAKAQEHLDIMFSKSSDKGEQQQRHLAV